MAARVEGVGALLRNWRARRRLTQLDLAGEVETPTRHLSFIETGRARPSRAMVLRLADRLEIPLRARNALLIAAGFAPEFAERSLADPAMTAVRDAVDQVLAGHEPYPALAIDRHWTLVARNRAVEPLLATVDPGLLRPPANLLRLSLHPAGIAPRIVNFAEWRSHLLLRAGRQLDRAPDPAFEALVEEVRGYRPPERGSDDGSSTGVDSGGDCGDVLASTAIATSLRLRCKYGELRFLSTTMIFGAPGDVTVAELAIESFFPLDRQTVELLRKIEASHAAAIAGAS